MNHKTTVVWFRRDLRVHDNPALWEAVQQGVVIPVFIWSPDEEADGPIGEASLWWLHHSLSDLDLALQQMGSKLIIRKGSSLQVLRELFQETQAHALYYNHRYDPALHGQDQIIMHAFKQEKIEVNTFHAHLLLEPLSNRNQQNQPYKIFTPFYKQFIKKRVLPPLPSPVSIPAFKGEIKTLRLEELALLPSNPWHDKFKAYWKPGESGAKIQFTAFMEEKLFDYKNKRDVPSANQVSRLSPYLAWGNISPKWIWYMLKEHILLAGETLEDMSMADQVESFIRQLVWREFAYDQMGHFPTMITTPLRPEFKSFPWKFDEVQFTHWKRGMTGYPFVDAGMRELWETGWMHNRVRMIAASFLVKHLLIPWTIGASWFRETLLDSDLANNSMGWQWVAGCGFDAAPYFRIFNPVAQGEKFDRNGDYIRRWIPELSKLPEKYIHRPWESPEDVLSNAGITLGVTYPYPIVDHYFARERALLAYH